MIFKKLFLALNFKTKVLTAQKIYFWNVWARGSATSFRIGKRYRYDQRIDRRIR